MLAQVWFQWVILQFGMLLYIKGMSSKGVYIGGALVAGGLLYWYLQRQQKDDGGGGGGNDGAGGYNPPTKENPAGGNTELPPGNATNPASQPISLIPPAANNSYQTSISDYPKQGFCGVNIGLRSGDAGGVSWGPLMAPYDTMAKCFGRQEVRTAAHTYMSNPSLTDDRWATLTNANFQNSQLIWVTADPTGKPTVTVDAHGYPVDTEWSDHQGCFYYNPANGNFTHYACPPIIPMGTPDKWGILNP
jgi:hypothetical protein